MPLANVPLANTPLANTPLANTPLSNTGISGVPLANTPLANTPLANTPLANTPLANTPLANTPLSNTGITDIPLANTPLANTPLANVDDAFPLANVPLANVPLANTPLANTPLANTPLANVANPEAFFDCGGACPADGLIGTYPVKAGVTWGALLDALDDETIVPIAAIVRDAALRSQLPAGVDLGQLLVSLDEEALVQVTLAALLRAPNGSGDFLALFSVLQLIDSVGRENATLSDLVSLLLDPGAFGWERLDLSSARPQDLDGTKGGQVRYEADVLLAKIDGPEGVKAEALVSIALPPEFSFRRGTASLVELDGAGNPIPATESALANPLPGAPFEWKLKLKVGTTYRVSVTSQAGTTLGNATASAAATPKFGSRGRTPRQWSSSSTPSSRTTPSLTSLRAGCNQRRLAVLLVHP